MLEIKGELKDYVKVFNGGYILTITTNTNNLSTEELTSLKSAKNGIRIDLSQWRDKRSLDSNQCLWKMLDLIAEKIDSTKEEVYKQFIKDVGVFEILPIKNIAVERFIRNWQSKGLGWVCESLGESKIKDYTNVIAYFGTSTYDTKEMSRLLDNVIEQAKELGIQTPSEFELQKMANEWEKKNAKQNK